MSEKLLSNTDLQQNQDEVLLLDEQYRQGSSPFASFFSAYLPSDPFCGIGRAYSLQVEAMHQTHWSIHRRSKWKYLAFSFKHCTSSLKNYFNPLQINFIYQFPPWQTSTPVLVYTYDCDKLKYTLRMQGKRSKDENIQNQIPYLLQRLCR